MAIKTNENIMKNILIIFIIFFGVSSCKTLQNKSKEKALVSEDIILFNKGVSIYEVVKELYLEDKIEKIDTLTQKGKIKYEILVDEKESILDLAFEKFEEYTEKYPKSKLYHKALYNLAQISSQIEYYEDEEIKYLNLILSSDANDKENSGRSGLMSNPYANFKNEASKRLTEIYIEKEDFKKALEYAELNKKYPYQHFCGNAIEADEIYNAETYGRIYYGLGNTKKALDFLLPKIFENGFASNSSLVELTYSILLKEFKLPYLKNEFSKSIQNFYSKKSTEYTIERNLYYIKFLENEIEIPNWTLFVEYDRTIKEKDIEKIIKQTEFYKKLNKEKAHNKD